MITLLASIAGFISSIVPEFIKYFKDINDKKHELNILAVKYLQYKAISTSAHVIEYLEVIWTIDDQAIFAGVISFYYGQRTFKNFWKNKYTESK